MLDPFPFPAPPLLSLVTQKLAAYTGYHSLALHIHEFIGAALFYHFICLYGAPFLSRLLFPRIYAGLSHKTKLNWDVHIVSLIQSVLVCVVALWVMWNDKERAAMDYRERVWGYTGAGGLLQALAGGYFVWDLFVSIVHIDVFGYGLLAHAVSALYVFAQGYRPFVNYYGPVFILYELSSPFLNFHWFFDKLGMTGSTAQLVNGLLLMISFFGSRLVWGPLNSVRVFNDLWKVLQFQETIEGKAWLKTPISPSTAISMGEAGKASREIFRFTPEPVPLWLAATYFGANTCLTGLNIYWFYKMIQTIRARFPPPFGTMTEAQAKKDKPDAKSAAMGRSVDSQGAKSIDVELKEVRNRGMKSKLSSVPHPPPH